LKPNPTNPFAKPLGRGEKKTPGPELMNTLLNRCGIDLSGVQLDQLWVYHRLLRRHDAELNLTRIRNFENMVIKLYADSMLPALKTRLPSPLMDLGSGPGMPGIPLKIFRPDLRILLAESRQQRVQFLKTVVGALHLPGLEVIERGIGPDYNRPVAGVITRAVEPIADTLARLAGCVEKDGVIVFMKGPRCDQEIERAARDCSSDYDLIDDTPYQIPHTPHRRRLVCYRRKTATVQIETKAQPATFHRIRAIESESNPIFRDLKKMLGGRGVKKLGKTLVCGRRLVAEAVAQSPERCLAWISSGDRHNPPPEAPQHLEWIQLTAPLFQELDQFGTHVPMVLYRHPPLAPWDADHSAPGCSLLTPFQDPENVGAVIRSAAAFAVERIVLLTESANPFHPKAIRASAGTVFSANLCQGPSLSGISNNLTVVALAASGRPIADFPFPDAFYLLPGMEGPGLSSRWQQNAVAIPMAGGVDSLNAAVATGIALYEWRRQKKG
jgi:16S rRNA (guanine527-N7)-methyltransferase